AHLTDVARASGRPVFFLTFDAAPRARVEASTREGAQMYALLRAIPFNPRFTLKKTTFFSNLDVWDIVMAKPLEERMAAFADPAKRAELREWADKRQGRAPATPDRRTARYSRAVLAEWVRQRQLLTLEDAIRRYTFQPARIMGLRDRGLIREGMAADLMVFDAATIGVKEDEVSRDGPSGTPRRVQGADGVHHVIVGGQVVLDHGRHTGAFPGRVLRAGRGLHAAR